MGLDVMRGLASTVQSIGNANSSLVHDRNVGTSGVRTASSPSKTYMIDIVAKTKTLSD